MRTRPLRYSLDVDGNPVPEEDLIRWATWFENGENRLLCRDELSGGIGVSTVFLGLDHNWSERGPPVLWETMIFGGPHDEYAKRYSSKAAALEGHREAVALAKSSVS
jgi:hypothetical protein